MLGPARQLADAESVVWLGDVILVVVEKLACSHARHEAGAVRLGQRHSFPAREEMKVGIVLFHGVR